MKSKKVLQRKLVLLLAVVLVAAGLMGALLLRRDMLANHAAEPTVRRPLFTGITWESTRFGRSIDSCEAIVRVKIGKKIRVIDHEKYEMDGKMCDIISSNVFEAKVLEWYKNETEIKSKSIQIVQQHHGPDFEEGQIYTFPVIWFPYLGVDKMFIIWGNPVNVFRHVRIDGEPYVIKLLNFDFELTDPELSDIEITGMERSELNKLLYDLTGDSMHRSGCIFEETAFIERLKMVIAGEWEG